MPLGPTRPVKFPRKKPPIPKKRPSRRQMPAAQSAYLKQMTDWMKGGKVGKKPSQVIRNIRKVK